MITLQEAKELALDALSKSTGRHASELAVVDDLSQCRRYGWILFYNSRRYLETGDEFEALGGNGPVVVLHDASVHILGSALAAEPTIAEFEREHGL